VVIGSWFIEKAKTESTVCIVCFDVAPLTFYLSPKGRGKGSINRSTD
jgi:hypothetical protein